MRICTYEKKGEKPRAGLVITLDRGETAILDINRASREALGQEIPSDIIQILDDWERNSKLLEKLGGEVDERFMYRLSEVRLLAPIPRPRKIIAALVNTRGMLGGELEKELKHPRLFMKAPSTVIGPEETILVPETGIRPEVELAAVIGKRIKKATEKEAEEAIIGYTILNDITAPAESMEDAYYAYRRDPETGEVRKVRMRGPLFRSKNHDTFTPLGPWITTKDEISDAGNLEMWTKFNGETIQHGSTSEYIFTPTEITKFTTTFITLEPADIISCGTIKWTKQTTKDPTEQTLPQKTGTLELYIQKIGTLKNKTEPEK